METGYLTILKRQIFIRSWDVESPVACMLMVHGMGTHSGRYSRIAAFLNSNNIAAFSYDHPGHGNSHGLRGHISRYEELLVTLQNVLDHFRSKHPGLPFFLYGHSMGGNVVANFVLRKKPKLNGVILSSPWLKLAFNPPFFKMMLARIVVNFFPSLRQNSRLNANYISHDKDVLKEYEADKLVHSYITPAFFISTAQAGLWAIRHAGAFHLPLYVYHGTDDRITLFSATRMFASKIPHATFKEWQGCYHEVHNEWVREELFKSILEFIEGNLTLTPSPDQNK